MNTDLDLFDTTSGKLSQLRALIAVIETADLSSFDDRIRGCYFWLALDLVTECEELLVNLDNETNHKIGELERLIEEQQKELNATRKNMKKAGGGL